MSSIRKQHFRKQRKKPICLPCIGIDPPSMPMQPSLLPLCHLLWHRVIDTDLTSRLLFVNAALAPYVQVWLVEKERQT